MRDGDLPLTHEWIWTAIDTVADRHQLSPSALARLAGLDPTTFNRSKRFTAEGRPRWPSTESIAKLLEATRTSLDEFAAIELAPSLEVSIDETREGGIDGVPLVGEVRNATVADWPTEGSANANWGRASRSGGRHLALAVADASLEPVYSCGNTLVISQDAATRPGDRVIVKPAGQSAVPRLLISSSRTLVGLERLGHPSAPESVRRRDIDWMARIVLVRQ